MSTPTSGASALHDGLLERVRRSLASTPGRPTPAAVASALRAEGAVLGDAAVLQVTDALRAELTGVGPLETLLRDPSVTDVLVNGPDAVWVDRGAGLERTAVRFPNDAAVRRLATRLVAAAGRRLDDAMPFADARLPGGVRLHAVIPPVAPDGTTLCLRVPPRRVFSLAELVDLGTVPECLVRWLVAIVEQRLAFLVTGGTGSGKTTILSSLLSLCGSDERIVLVEDSGELRPEHEHVVRLEARPSNVEGNGRVGLDELVRQALRMRPDRIVVGEVRGPEVVDLLTALNTGQAGGCGTLHANTATDTAARLEALGVAAGLPREAVQALALAALDVVLHVRRATPALRMVAQLGVVGEGDDGRLTVRTAFNVDSGGRVTRGTGYKDLVTELGERGWSP